MNNGKTLLITNAHLVDSKLDCFGSILIENGVISKIIPENDYSFLSKVDSSCIIDAKKHTVMPSFIDMHTHSRYPGQETKETLETFLQAAAAGGFGTVVCMANTNPIISSWQQAIDVEKQAKIINKVDLIQAVSITKDFAGEDTSHLNEKPLTFSHIPFISEDGKDVASSQIMLEAMQKCSKLGAIVSCHSEDNSLAAYTKSFRLTNTAKANEILRLAEDIATIRNIEIAEYAKCKIHIAHVSTEKSIEEVRNAKKRKIDISCEVTPHHIALCLDQQAGMLQHIVNPPIRNEKDRLSLIQAIIDKTADVIATDHAPHSFEDKQNGAPGFSGIETAFSVCYTTLVDSKKITLSQLSALMSDNPAKRLGLQDSNINLFLRGRLQEGFFADLVFIDTTKHWNVKNQDFYSKGKYSPFDGMKLAGKIEKTFFRGHQVF